MTISGSSGIVHQLKPRTLVFTSGRRAYANMASIVSINTVEVSLVLTLLIFFCLLLWSPTTSAQQNSDWTTLVEAERAFAAASLSKGSRAAFLEFLAEDSVLFRPGAVSGKKWIEEHPAPSTLLTWEPTFADIAQSGDLGYTTGPWEIRPNNPQDTPSAYGHFVSVWKRQSDGTWKVALDLGISHAAPAGKAKPLQAVDFREGSDKGRRNVRVDEEKSELLGFDRELANLVSQKGSAQAYLRYLADDARLYRANAFPVIGKREIFVTFSQSGGRASLRPDKADVSSAADLGYIYGTTQSVVSGSGGAAAAASNYLHIWKRKGKSWTLVLDVESPVPPRASTQ